MKRCMICGRMEPADFGLGERTYCEEAVKRDRERERV